MAEYLDDIDAIARHFELVKFHLFGVLLVKRPDRALGLIPDAHVT